MTFNLISCDSALKQFLSLTFLLVMEACALDSLLCYYTENHVTTKVEEDVMIKFCKSQEMQKQLLANVLQNSYS